MNGIAALRANLESTAHLLRWFLSDFSDADLLVRPVPGANHAAWQVGNVIGGDVLILTAQLPNAAFPALPEGFKERYGNEGTTLDDGFPTKNELIALFDQVRAATIAALDGLSDADLDRPTTGDMARICPTLGHVFGLLANHTLLHVGQFSVIRRKLEKPVLL
jgi:hypothetical protein